MTHRLRVTPQAEADLLDAYHWHESKQAGLGDAFLDEAEAAFERIQDSPDMYVEVEPGIRRSLTHTFPYLVLYAIDLLDIVVIAVVHAAQDPEYIKTRMVV